MGICIYCIMEIEFFVFCFRGIVSFGFYGFFRVRFCRDRVRVCLCVRIGRSIFVKFGF